MKNYNPDKNIKSALSKAERKAENLRQSLDSILNALDSEKPEYSSDLHQLVDSAQRAVDSAFLTLNIVNYGIYNKSWTNDNWNEAV